MVIHGLVFFFLFFCVCLFGFFGLFFFFGGGGGGLSDQISMYNTASVVPSPI